MYEVLFSSASERFLKKIKETGLKDAYKKAILKIRKNPYIGHPKRGDLPGIYGLDVKHKGVNYEVAYSISEVNGKKVVILLAGTRENFYEELKRYLK